MSATANIRFREGTDDRAILREVSMAYFPNMLPYATFSRVVDLGAHIGGWSALCKLYAPHCNVLAFEPNEANLDILKQNMSQFDGVTVIPLRCAYAWKRARYIAPTNGNTGGTGYVPDATAAIVPSTTLEPHLWTDGFDIDCLKIDTEGAEFDILMNAPLATLGRFKHIIGEYHSGSGNIDAVFAHLNDDFRLNGLTPTSLDLGIFWLKRRDVR